MSSVLPPRPCRLRAGFLVRSYLFVALAPLPALAAVALCIDDEVQLLQRLRAEDELARDGEVVPAQLDAAPSHSGLLLHDYVLRVRFTDRRGAEHAETAVFSTLGATIDQGAPAQVHYDPSRPSRWVLSHARSVRLGRALRSPLHIAMTGALLALFLSLAVLHLREIDEARRCAAGSDEIEVEVLSTRRLWYGPRGSNLVCYRVRVPPGDGRTAEERTFTFDLAAGGPLIAGPPPAGDPTDARRLVALRGARGAVVVPRADVYPFASRGG